MSDRQTITRKITIFPEGNKEEVDRVYKYIRDGIKAQNKAMNQYMSALYMAEIEKISKEDRKELNSLYRRISTSKKGSAYPLDIQFPKGLPTTASLGQKVKQDFSKSRKNGLMYGRVALPNYKLTSPLLVHVDYIRLRSTNPHIDFGIYHEYDSLNDLVEALNKEKEPKIRIKFANNIVFKVVFGNKRQRTQELRSVFKNIFEENYIIQSSSIQFNKTGKKIILNLSLSIPKKEIKLDENVVVGVDLGLAIPAYCALNTNYFIKNPIGNKRDLLFERTKIQNQKRRLQSSLSCTSGGHGRKKKLQKLDYHSNHEKEFVRTYNHMVSKRVVDFAVKHNAAYINLEDLSGFSEKEKNKRFILRNWSYYQLQQQIKYKADYYGITVRFIKPHYTSQTCSCCGNRDKNQRINQAEFICNNPKCKIYGKKLNADFNAARNIAMSEEFVKEIAADLTAEN